MCDINPALIEVEKSSDSETLYSDEEESSLQSLPGSIYDHVYENGRRYHSFKRGTYPYPNDEKENERLDIIEHMVRTLVGGRLFLSPLNPDEIETVLDIGCGTGIYTLQLAEELPRARIIGTDLSPIQPNWVPPNVHFQIDDCEDSWSFREQFDFIRIGNMVGAIKNWKRLIEQAYNQLRPGGWLEISEAYFWFFSADNTLPEESALKTWCELIVGASKEYGQDLAPNLEWTPLVEEVGFENITETKLILPMNAWPKDEGLKLIGRYLRIVIEDGLEALSLGLLTRQKGWKSEEVTVLLAQVRQDLRRRDIHSYMPYNITVAQKPL